MDTIGDDLPKQMARIRDVILPEYAAIGQSGIFAATMIRHDLDIAAKAMAEGDLIEMIRVYWRLRNTK